MNPLELRSAVAALIDVPTVQRVRAYRAYGGWVLMLTTGGRSIRLASWGAVRRWLESAVGACPAD